VPKQWLVKSFGLAGLLLSVIALSAWAAGGFKRGVTTATTPSLNDTPTATQSPPAALSPTLAVPSDVEQSFAVFRLKRTVRDAVPQLLKSRLRKETGENVQLARYARSIGTRTDLYLVPGVGQLCLRDQRGSGGCALSRDLSSGTLAFAEPCPIDGATGSVRLTGALPDGAHRLYAEDASGRDQYLSLTAKVDAADVPVGSLPITLHWTAANGDSGAMQAPVPSDAATYSCK